MTLTRLYGLTIRSELPLHQNRPVLDQTEPDLELRLGETVPPSDRPPPGRVLLHLQVDRQYYTATQADDGYLLRFYGTCDVRLSPDLSQATVCLYPGADPAIGSVLAGGTVVAFVLAMRGAAVLHASAVQIGDAALGFVGGSGMGKSTTATLLCADGASLITDDLLRLDLTRRPPTCSLGATELRLRKAAAELADRFQTAPRSRITGDERDALTVSRATTEELPLAALVIPVPDRSAERTTAEVRRLNPMEAFLTLSRFPRLLGWLDEDIMRRQFQQLGDIVESVPVHLARLPWGPPFPDDIAATVRRAVGLA